MDHQPNDNNNYQSKLDEALLKQDSAAADDKIDIFLIEADYALKYVDSAKRWTSGGDIGLTDDDLEGPVPVHQGHRHCRWRPEGHHLAGDPGLFALPPFHRYWMCWAPMIPPKSRPP